MAPQPAELTLRLETAASPARVAEAASLFRDVLAALDPALGAEDVTLVVSNLRLEATARGRSGPGRAAVATFERLVRNPMHEVQAAPERGRAALQLATHARRFVSYGAMFLDGKKAEISRIDPTFVNAMQAVARDMLPPSEGSDLHGETVVFSRVYRFGRIDDEREPMARIHIDGRPLEIRVAPDLEDSFWAAAQSGNVLPIRLQGRWSDQEGELDLRHPVAISIDTTFALWTGKELLDEAKRLDDAFSRNDFDRMLADLRAE